MAITKWQAKAEKLAKGFKNLKEATLGNVVHVRHDAETVMAAAMMGGVRGAFEATGKQFDIPGPGGSKIPPELIIGSIVLGIGVTDAAMNKTSETAADFHAAGSGILALAAGNMTRDWMRTRQKPAA